MPIKIPMIAITTSNSTKVKAVDLRRRFVFILPTKKRKYGNGQVQDILGIIEKKSSLDNPEILKMFPQKFSKQHNLLDFATFRKSKVS